MHYNSAVLDHDFVIVMTWAHRGHQLEVCARVAACRAVSLLVSKKGVQILAQALQIRIDDFLDADLQAEIIVTNLPPAIAQNYRETAILITENKNKTRLTWSKLFPNAPFPSASSNFPKIKKATWVDSWGGVFHSTIGEAAIWIGRSEVQKLALDVPAAKRQFIDALVRDNAVSHDFSQVIAGAIVGATRFPLWAHFPLDVAVFELWITPHDLGRLHILNERSWTLATGEKCANVSRASALLQASQPETAASRSAFYKHAEIISFLRKLPHEDLAQGRVLVGAALNWRGGITILDGNHRAILFYRDRWVRKNPVRLLIGISTRWARPWPGNFFCSDASEMEVLNSGLIKVMEV